MTDALVFVLTMLGLTEIIVQVCTIWNERPAVGLDPNTGHYRSVRRMAAERRRG